MQGQINSTINFFTKHVRIGDYFMFNIDEQHFSCFPKKKI